MVDRHGPDREFHISRLARGRYGIDESLFALRGGVVVANFHAARVLAQRLNARRDLARFPETAVRAGQINALGLIDEVLHLVLEKYRRERSPRSLANALAALTSEHGAAAVDATLLRFVDEFPPLAVHRGEIEPRRYLEGETGGVPNREVLLEELLMLHLANANPASAPLAELFDDGPLRRDTAYVRLAAGLRAHFDSEPFFGPAHQNLVDMLRAPAVAVPHSLAGQLEYIREHWGFLLGELVYRLLAGLDMIAEEEKPVVGGPGAGGAPPPGHAPVLEFGGLAAEPERFSPDREWMPRLVLIAKNAYVWLDQLSRRYGRTLSRLDEIPDEELDTLARWGFSGLWLIGVWERSRASQRIKQLCGNPEAVASAYSLADYRIADDLGGEAAYQALRERAWRRGIRMATDMVPNHMGIDSRWVVEHPNWFIALDHSPFPAYSFNGPDLSSDDRVGIFLEDHYYSRSDAAVVFKRVDRWTGAERFVYHGNDGTSMPWNDTAQLNYLIPEVREAVIQTILHVARLSPIIRFDAAMTLAKKHYQRLWFPEPGTGGAIPTRAGLGLTREQLDAAMPVEFWREVVDRVAAEAPDTLLLAEAFWLMEGYFVRTLGMHRVYNSAFMNMLRDEDNAKYRSVLKNTLEFDPEVLKRYVNFMNNPDERTAVDQFGKGDKYFGIATLLATLPGLPMFGHGQVEGLTEKYGMEYRRAYRDEHADGHLVWRHEQELFPLLHRRHLFAGVEHFRLYDFITADGSVNEDVFAFSNRHGDDRALVIYHNRWADTRGWVRTSAAWAVRRGEERNLATAALHEGLGLECGERWFSIFRDQATGLEYLRSNRELIEHGLWVELGAYRRHVFVDFRQVEDDATRRWFNLCEFLGGRGVPSIAEALRRTFLQPLHEAFTALAGADALRRLADAAASGAGSAARAALLDEVEAGALRVLAEVRQLIAGRGDERRAAAEVRRTVAALLELAAAEAPQAPGAEALAAQADTGAAPAAPAASAAGATTAPPAAPQPAAAAGAHAAPAAAPRLAPGPPEMPVLLAWALTRSLGAAVAREDAAQHARSGLDEWLLARILAQTFAALGADEGAAAHAVLTVKVLVAHQEWYRDLVTGDEPLGGVVETWLADADVRHVLQVNRHRDVLWFNREAADRLLSLLVAAATAAHAAEPGMTATEGALHTAAIVRVAQRLRDAARRSEFQVERFIALAAAPGKPAAAPPADVTA
jgi:glycosidase